MAKVVEVDIAREHVGGDGAVLAVTLLLFHEDGSRSEKYVEVSNQ